MTCLSERPRHRQAGFTLLEMLVVLLLLGVATALVAPRLASGGARLDGDTRLLASRLAAARDQAVRQGRAVEISLDARGLSQGTSLTVAGEVERGADGLARLRFLPDGSASGAEIRLRGPHGGERAIAVDWLTGRVVHDAR
ncbi:type II secretion system protein GspH [Niveispirillum sp. SYP-B3756]|uniref:GspH/FimT family pseudopilin n=1 Tax=Niveispirillum sp. SYP-B3756 TaxID=2662178 RepID=UPI001291F34E|nr:GspH/FimT family pseudopilin [Niveispirillum sp. SYP-B3756]MQP68101.1 type II secretion system protein GspH [Niveispirillum sp. SYP-B3756]